MNVKVFTAAQMRDFDAAATGRYAIPSAVLMENSALRVVEFLEQQFPPLHQRSILIVCGKGNNGGDGLAIARHLQTAGARPRVLLAAEPSELKGDARIQFDAVSDALGGCLRQIDDSAPGDLEQWATVEAGRSDIALDAVLGTGFRGSIASARLRKALAVLRAHQGRRIAIDLPSGLDSDTGEAVPEAVPCDFTVTLAAPKRGLFLREGPGLAGRIWVGGIGTTARQMEATPADVQCLTAWHHPALPARPVDAHKGIAGRVLLCGGSLGMTGAPTLAARAVLRAGAGLCIVCLPERALPIVAAAFAEATTHPLLCDEQGRLVGAAADQLPELWSNADVVALGPGLSRAPGALEFARRVVRHCPKPLIVDADALYALPAIAGEVRARTAPTVLTPHPGEMAELMGCGIGEVQNDRIGTVRACSDQYGAIVVLKGARSLIALPGGMVHINLIGNSGMATGGAGDVLTGAIAGLLGQLKDAAAATLLGVHLHGLAGNLAYAKSGNGLIAGDIAEELPQALIELAAAEKIAPGRLYELR